MDGRDPLVKELTEFCISLLRNINEDAVRLETIRVLLEKNGVFSNDDYQQALQVMQALWDENHERAVHQADEASHIAKLRRLLEDYEGPKQ